METVKFVVPLCFVVALILGCEDKAPIAPTEPSPEPVTKQEQPECDEDGQDPVFTGTGKQITRVFNLKANRRYLLQAEFPRASFLIVHLNDATTGEVVEYLFNEFGLGSDQTGDRTLSASFNVDDAGEFYFEIDNIRSNWELTLEGPGFSPPETECGD